MWRSAGRVADFLKDAGKTVEMEGLKVALFNVNGKFYAMADACPHRGGPLGEGFLGGSRVTCPWHAWEFDVKTGECSTMKGAKQKTYAIKIENEEVWVDF